MTLHQWLGLAALAAIVGFVIFTFRQGFKVKPDPNNRNFSAGDPGGQAPSDGS
jgi:hypothetical protein